MTVFLPSQFGDPEGPTKKAEERVIASFRQRTGATAAP
jgi:hypothetical protein